MRDLVKVMTINDLHFGTVATQRMYSELHLFKEKLQEYKPDILIFAGDYFDHKLALTDTASYYAMMFFNEAYEICKKNRIIVRMLQGTRGHELNQLQMFKPHEADSEMNFKIIENLSEEELLGLNILYVPEEYPETYKYYSEYFEDKAGRYDLISMHGTVDVVEGGEIMAKAVEGRSNVAPVFKHDVLMKLLKPSGYVSAGHIHQQSNYKNKILYSGAYTRWRYDDTTERGFTYFEFSEDSSKFEFIINTEAPVYKTIRLDDMAQPFGDMDVVEIQSLLMEQANKYDNTKFVISGISSDKADILRKYFSQYDNIKVEMAKLDDSSILNEDVSPEDKEKFEKYNYIVHPSSPLVDRIQRYVKEELNKEISKETIEYILKKE